jgi:DNA-3-methyladenine glycosylase I
MSNRNRCFGNGKGKEFYADYHDNEWGIPVYDDTKLFEMIILEGAQAGLSWETILKKRQGYRDAFYNFDINKVSKMTDHKLEQLRENTNIVRNKLKIYSVRTNAISFLKLQLEHQSFSKYIWKFVNNKPIVNHWECFEQVPTTTTISDLISKDLKYHGMKFIGSTIIYAYMQAVGIVCDHLTSCWCYKNNKK